MAFQALLFGDDTEAEAQEATRIAALERQTAYAEARKLAWDKGKPFPEDEAKWSAAQMAVMDALYLKPFWEEPREYYRSNVIVTQNALESNACSRANRLGRKVGRRGPILEVYRKAVHAPVVLCYWCKKLTFPKERHVDHKQPLTTGGPH